MSNNSTIICPNCKHEFHIEHALSQKIEDEIKGRYLKKYNEDKQRFEQEKSQLARESEQLKLQAENMDKIVSEKLKAAKIQLEQDAIKKAAADSEMKIQLLNNELKEKADKLKESQMKELELMKKENQIKEREENLKFDMEKQMLERQKEIEERVKKMESERAEFKIKELEKKLSDQAELVETMKRKAEQGSMQLQGEILELALEELLKATFPTDVIEEVAKGVKGADCIQFVKNKIGQPCGKIIYESKRTKAFANEWIEKLKQDMRAQQADIAVIVTETMPKDMDNFGFKDGVWICRFADVKPISFLLRDSLLKINNAIISQENKGDKMQLLYDYLTGNEFRQNVEAVAEGFLSMREGIIKEKMQMDKIWKEREKQLDKVLLNTAQFYGSIKGIAGNALGDLKMLE